MLPEVKRFETNRGRRVYRASGQAFADLVVHVYLIFGPQPPILVDTGSGFGQCNEQILQGIKQIRADFGESFELTDIERIMITHGHVDHFGGLGFFHDLTAAKIAIHEYDLRVLTAFEERVTLATWALRRFLDQAGVEPARREEFIKMYSFSKQHVRDFEVDLVLADGQRVDGIDVIHAPGHCSGQVCLGVDDILLTADQVLPHTTPHLAPESITHNTGLGHYLDALWKVRGLAGYGLALGGHEGPMENYRQRIDEIRASHLRKLERIYDLIAAAKEPTTINEISQNLYSRVQGFHVLLAVEEVGAHVEYLYQSGGLAIANLHDIERDGASAVRYRTA